MKMYDELTRQLNDSINRIQEKSITVKEKVFQLYTLMNIICEEATSDENLHFPSLFARINYLSGEFGISKQDEFYIHKFRIKNERQKPVETEYKTLFELGVYINRILIDSIWGKGDAPISLSVDVKKFYQQDEVTSKGFKNLIEALVISIDYQQKRITYLDEDVPGIKFNAEFDIPHINEPFTKNILSIEKVYKLPISVNLIDVDIIDNALVRPKAFVINPDYLMDVTSVSSYSGKDNSELWLFSLNKFKPKVISKYLMLGNIANYLLDVLISNPDIELKSLFKNLFLLFPIDWSLFDNQVTKEIMELTSLHFKNLKRVVQKDFVKKDILLGQIYLEPSFYCRDYGIQGRLDLFHVNQDGDKADIIELKSGSVFRPNAYGINPNHYTQTLLYDMMITSAYEEKLKTKNYILYSKLDQLNLKYAPRIKTKQYEMIIARNDLVSLEQAMSKGAKYVSQILSHLTRESYQNLSGFTLSELKLFEEVYQTASKVEREYFNHFTSFITRELILAKTGENGINKSNGLSGLWLESIEEKIERFGIINHIKLLRNESSSEDPFLIFQKTEATATLSNFRQGDIAVLYPHHHNERKILKHQVFKCSIIQITDDEVHVRMRSPQYNQEVFRTTEYWNIEHDVLTSSFNHMYRNLFTFISAEKEKRQLILGEKRPEYSNQELKISLQEGMTGEQKSIVYKAFNTKDYLLIWGPPGTGKTSMVLKNLVHSLHTYTDEKVLLLAYTNRAVDEICDALFEADLSDHFLRIGSRYSVAAPYQSHLFDSNIKDLNSRKEIIGKLKDTRIFVSTIASILGKMSLFEIINFETVIIDEASQILEPMIVGLLPKFDRFIMIGDHKQLPAVVTQDSSLTEINEVELNQIGIHNMSVSLFERLLTQCKKNNWDNGWAILTQQGRMHDQIMYPVNKFFYENKLKKIPGIQRLTKVRKSNVTNELSQQLYENRLLFIDTKEDVDLNWKTNLFEAEAVVKVISNLKLSYRENGYSIENDKIGVITPYRAQIALIKSLLPIEDNLITVDTVERYQGGAREIIILSLCTNKLSQLESLVSLSSEGIDRKLNVALTRAKEQIIIIGNKEILSTNNTYAQLINSCHLIDLFK